MGLDTLTLLAALAAVLLWGLWGFLGRLALTRGMPALSIFVAEAVAGFVCAAVLVGLLVATKRPVPWQLPWNLWGFLSGAAVAVGLAFYYVALGRGQAAVIVPLTATYPAIAVLLAYALLGERPTAAQWIGLLLVVVGAALLLAPRPAS